MKIELKPIGGGGWSLRYTVNGRAQTKLFTSWPRVKAATRKILNGVDPDEIRDWQLRQNKTPRS